MGFILSCAADAFGPKKIATGVKFLDEDVGATCGDQIGGGGAGVKINCTLKVASGVDVTAAIYLNTTDVIVVGAIAVKNLRPEQGTIGIQFFDKHLLDIDIGIPATKSINASEYTCHIDISGNIGGGAGGDDYVSTPLNLNPIEGWDLSYGAKAQT